MIIYPWNQNKCYRTKKEKEMEVKQRNREAKKKKDKWNEEKKGIILPDRKLGLWNWWVSAHTLP